ncbi:PAS domain S-box protein [uncultured Desulfobacter sp.]|uniref:PAS domain S-box protein n=1 Tax=uncultured Desulfobacter sp. TaxID=240139 RepID=UPI002AAB8FC5|nr:PAS domain S-box protein [uncultured Desulfobacter sp.]
MRKIISFVALFLLLSLQPGFCQDTGPYSTNISIQSSNSHLPNADDFLGRLTESERTWLKKHPVIKIGIDPNRPPYEFVDDQGEYRGMTASYLDVIAGQLGITFQQVKHSDGTAFSWSEDLEGARTRKIDLIPCLFQRQDRESFLLFSEPYIQCNTLLIAPYVYGMSRRIQDFHHKKIAVVKYLNEAKRLDLLYPDVEFVLVETSLQGLRALNRGDVAAFAGDPVVIAYLSRHNSLHRMEIVSFIGGGMAAMFHMGVRKDWPEFVAILDKALKSITPEEQAAIHDQWISLEFYKGYNWQATGKIMLAAALGSLGIILIIAFAYIRLKKEIRLRRQSDQALANSFEQNSLILESVGTGIMGVNKEGYLTFINSSGLSLLGFSEQELRAAPLHDLIHSRSSGGVPLPQEMCPICNPGISEGSCVMEDFFCRKDGSLLPVQYLFKPILKNQKNIGTVISFQDISERLQVEKKMRASEDNLRFALKAADASYWHYDWLHDRITVDVHLYGDENTPKTLEEFLALVHPEDQKRVGNAMLQHFRSEVPFVKVDYRFGDKQTGQWRWIHCTGRPVDVDEQGRPIAVAGLSLDITNRQILLEAVKTSQERLHIISEHTYDWQSWQNLEGKLLWVNRAVERITGYSIDECTTMANYPVPLIDEHDRALFEKIKKNVLADNVRQEKNLRIRQKDGGLVWVSWSMEPVRNPQGQIMGITSVAKDITPQKEALQALRLMSKVFEDSIDPIFLVDHETRKIVDFNRAAVSAYGYSRAELLGGYMTLVTPEPLIEQIDVLYSRCITGELCRSIEWQRRKKNGEILPVLLSLSLLKDGDGKIQGIASMSRDISALKKAEQELKEYGDHLEELVRERTADLAQAMQIAETATKAKSDFLANISHEIRTPLNAIVGFVHLALQTGLNSRQRDYLTKIQKSTKSLLNIINDILDFSKIEAAKLTLEVTEFYLGDVLDTVTNLIDIKAREKGLELVFNIDPRIPQALAGDPLRLSQVLVNLIGNAVKFTDQGQILLSCCLVKDGADGVELEFSIQDSGVGLTQEHQARLFQAFSQADTSTTRKYGGTGLGLSISKNIVEMMGGGIQVHSQFGKGATFSFTVCLKKAVSLPALDLVPDVSFRHNKVLLIDDNSVCRMALGQMLESMAFQVAQASGIETGREACENVWESGACDLVLLDGDIYGARDVNVIRKLKHDLKEAPLFIIMITSYSKDAFFQKTGMSEFNACLTKPVTPFLLLDTIMRAFGKQGLYVSYPDQKKTLLIDIERIKGVRLLVAEDNAFNQQVVRDLLEQNGFAVDIADNGKMVLEKLKENDYDGILMDIHMPEMDGYTTSRRIRQIHGNRDLPIIALTANTTAEDREKVVAAGMDDLVGKPIHIPTLLAVLCKWVRCKEGDFLGPLPTETKPLFTKKFEGSALPVRQGLDARDADTVAGSDKEPDYAIVRQLLLDLQKLLARDDSRAGDVVQELTGLFPGMKSSSLFSILSRQVSTYSYDDAGKTLDRLFKALDEVKEGNT